MYSRWAVGALLVLGLRELGRAEAQAPWIHVATGFVVRQPGGWKWSRITEGSVSFKPEGGKSDAWADVSLYKPGSYGFEKDMDFRQIKVHRKEIDGKAVLWVHSLEISEDLSCWGVIRERPDIELRVSVRFRDAAIAPAIAEELLFDLARGASLTIHALNAREDARTLRHPEADFHVTVPDRIATSEWTGSIEGESIYLRWKAVTARVYPARGFKSVSGAIADVRGYFEKEGIAFEKTIERHERAYAEAPRSEVPAVAAVESGGSIYFVVVRDPKKTAFEDPQFGEEFWELITTGVRRGSAPVPVLPRGR